MVNFFEDPYGSKVPGVLPVLVEKFIKFLFSCRVRLKRETIFPACNVLGISAAAFLIFFPGTARAGIVRIDFSFCFNFGLCGICQSL